MPIFPFRRRSQRQDAAKADGRAKKAGKQQEATEAPPPELVIQREETDPRPVYLAAGLEVATMARLKARVAAEERAGRGSDFPRVVDDVLAGELAYLGVSLGVSTDRGDRVGEPMPPRTDHFEQARGIELDPLLVEPPFGRSEIRGYGEAIVGSMSATLHREEGIWTRMERPSDATIAAALTVADAPVEASASQRLSSLRMALPFAQKHVEREYAQLRQQVIRLDAEVHRLQRLHNQWAPDPNSAKPEPGMGSADQSMRMLRASATNEELIRKWTQVAELKEKMADMERRYPYLANPDT